MLITHDWTRKRTAHNSACWECYRCHRACDGARPCKRCIDTGQGSSCRSPAPNERIPRKRKKPKSDEQPPKRRSPHKIRKHTFFIVNPPMFLASSLSATNDAPPFESPLSYTSSSSTTDSFQRPSNLDRLNDNIAVGCSNYNDSPKLQTYMQPTEPILEHQVVQRPPPYPLAQQTQITLADDFPLSVEELLAEFGIETEETSDHPATTVSVFESLTIPDDLMQLSESLFAPFCLRDSKQVLFPVFLFLILPLPYQPFIVFKPTLVDRGMLNSALHDPNKQTTIACPLFEFTLLTASPSFCNLIGWSEVRPQPLQKCNCLY